jgi:hypothetical protein
MLNYGSLYDFEVFSKLIVAIERYFKPDFPLSHLPRLTADSLVGRGNQTFCLSFIWDNSVLNVILLLIFMLNLGRNFRGSV